MSRRQFQCQFPEFHCLLAVVGVVQHEPQIVENLDGIARLRAGLFQFGTGYVVSFEMIIADAPQQGVGDIIGIQFLGLEEGLVGLFVFFLFKEPVPVSCITAGQIVRDLLVEREQAMAVFQLFQLLFDILGRGCCGCIVARPGPAVVTRLGGGVPGENRMLDSAMMVTA